MWDSGYILNVDPTGAADGLVVLCETKRGVKELV